MKHLIRGIIVVAIFGLAFAGFHNIKQNQNQIKLEKIQLQSTEVKLKNLEIEYQEATKELEVHKGSTVELEKTRKHLQELEKQKAELERQLQAKLQQKRSLALTQRVSAASFTGSCADWMTQAGVTDFALASELIRRESGCRTTALNPDSGACGIAQELPCNKSGCGGVGGDPVCQIRWMQNYVNGRYGGWAQAIAFHDIHNYY